MNMKPLVVVMNGLTFVKRINYVSHAEDRGEGKVSRKGDSRIYVDQTHHNHHGIIMLEPEIGAVLFSWGTFHHNKSSDSSVIQTPVARLTLVQEVERGASSYSALFCSLS